MTPYAIALWASHHPRRVAGCMFVSSLCLPVLAYAWAALLPACGMSVPAAWAPGCLAGVAALLWQRPARLRTRAWMSAAVLVLGVSAMIGALGNVQGIPASTGWVQPVASRAAAPRHAASTPPRLPMWQLPQVARVVIFLGMAALSGVLCYVLAVAGCTLGCAGLTITPALVILLALGTGLFGITCILLALLSLAIPKKSP